MHYLSECIICQNVKFRILAQIQFLPLVDTDRLDGNDNLGITSREFSFEYTNETATFIGLLHPSSLCYQANEFHQVASRFQRLSSNYYRLFSLHRSITAAIILRCRMHSVVIITNIDRHHHGQKISRQMDDVNLQPIVWRKLLMDPVQMMFHRFLSFRVS